MSPHPTIVDLTTLGDQEGAVEELRLCARDAYDGYTHVGRGLLIVTFEPYPRDRFITDSLFVGRPALADFGMPRPVRRLAGTYDPQRESIVVFISPVNIIAYVVPLEGPGWPLVPAWHSSVNEPDTKH